jgi:hypothetical protein
MTLNFFKRPCPKQPVTNRNLLLFSLTFAAGKEKVALIKSSGLHKNFFKAAYGKSW